MQFCRRRGNESFVQALLTSCPTIKLRRRQNSRDCNMKTIGASWPHNLNERTHERVQILLPALSAAFPVRRTVLWPRNSVSRLPSSHPHSVRAGQNGGLPAGVRENLGDLCASRKCAAAERIVHQSEEGRTQSAFLKAIPAGGGSEQTVQRP